MPKRKHKSDPKILEATEQRKVIVRLKGEGYSFQQIVQKLKGTPHECCKGHAWNQYQTAIKLRSAEAVKATDKCIQNNLARIERNLLLLDDAIDHLAELVATKQDVKALRLMNETMDTQRKTIHEIAQMIPGHLAPTKIEQTNNFSLEVVEEIVDCEGTTDGETSPGAENIPPE